MKVIKEIEIGVNLFNFLFGLNEKVGSRISFSNKSTKGIFIIRETPMYGVKVI